MEMKSIHLKRRVELHNFRMHICLTWKCSWICQTGTSKIISFSHICWLSIYRIVLMYVNYAFFFKKNFNYVYWFHNSNWTGGWTGSQMQPLHIRFWVVHYSFKNWMCILNVQYFYLEPSVKEMPAVKLSHIYIATWSHQILAKIKSSNKYQSLTRTIEIKLHRMWTT